MNSNSGSVHVTLLADIAMILAGLLYCSFRVFQSDIIEFRRRSAADDMSFFNLLSFIGCLFSMWILVQMTASMLFSKFGDAGLTAYSENLQDANPIEMLILVVLIAPTAEEILMRGIVQTLLRNRFGPVPAVLVSSFVFAALHGTWSHLYVGFVLGILFGFAYEKLRCLPLCISMHVSCNFLSILASGLSYHMTSLNVVLVVCLNIWMAYLLFGWLRSLHYQERVDQFMAINDFDENVRHGG